MKKFKTLGVTALIAGMISLTSCLDGGTNTQTGYSFGYSTFNLDAGALVVEDDFGTVVSSSGFSALKGNEYVMYSYEVDWESQKSSSYINVTCTGLEKIPEMYTKSFLTDTTTLLDNEMPISAVSAMMYSYAYVLTANKHAFITTTHNNVPSDINMDYDFSWDYNAGPTELEGGVRVYEFYLRAMKVANGEKVETDTSIMNAFDLTDFLRTARSVENSAGNSVVNIRIHYISDLSGEEPMWKTSDVYSFVIPTEASNY